MSGRYPMRRLTCCFYMKTVEFATCICDGIHPLRGNLGVNALWIGDGSEKTLHLFGLGNHHVAVHENSWDTLSHAFQYGCAYAEGLGNILTSRSGGLSGHTHRDIRHEMAEKFIVLVMKCPRGTVSGGIYPSITSATA